MVGPEIAIMASCVGGTASFVSAWLSVGATLSASPIILSVLLMRGFVQQIIHNIEYTKFKDNILRVLQEKEFKKEFRSILEEAQKRINNANAIKLKHLNWNKNPAIKEAAERLGIFENPLSAYVPLNLETNPALKEIVK